MERKHKLPSCFVRLGASCNSRQRRLRPAYAMRIQFALLLAAWVTLTTAISAIIIASFLAAETLFFPGVPFWQAVFANWSVMVSPLVVSPFACMRPMAVWACPECVLVGLRRFVQLFFFKTLS